MREEFELTREEFEVPTESRVSHILLDLEDDATEARIDEIQTALAEGSDFAELATRYSIDIGSAQAGGDLGYTAGDAFPEPMEAAIALLEVGEISAPVETDAGVHLTVGDRDGDGDEDLFWSSSTTGASGVVENVSLGSIGAPECSPAVPNSTGSSGRIRGAGSTALGIGRTRLVVDRLPAGVTTLFLASRTAGATPVMGSVGTLCLGGAIGRFNGPGEIGSTTASGFRVLDVDLDAIPRPNALVAAAPGETWRFSAWHRDTVAGQATSNFTDAVAISFQ